MNNKTLQTKLKQYREMYKAVRMLESNMEDLKQEIIKELQRRKKEELILGDFKVSYKSELQKRFDSKMFREEYETLYDQFLKETTVSRFLLK